MKSARLRRTAWNRRCRPQDGRRCDSTMACSSARYRSQVTGLVMPKLAAYDDPMTAFLREHDPPGAALAVTYLGRLVYARGFGHADLEEREPVRPASLFRIASLSKPVTAAAVMHLVEQGKLRLDDRVFPILNLPPQLGRRSRFDPRWHDITVRHCLQHTAGWDRDKSRISDRTQAALAAAKARGTKLGSLVRTLGRPGRQATGRPKIGARVCSNNSPRGGPGNRPVPVGQGTARGRQDVAGHQGPKAGYSPGADAVHSTPAASRRGCRMSRLRHAR